MDEMRVDDGAGRQRRIPVDYPSNSKRAREQAAEKNVTKIVEGEVTTRKKAGGINSKEPFLVKTPEQSSITF